MLQQCAACLLQSHKAANVAVSKHAVMACGTCCLKLHKQPIAMFAVGNRPKKEPCKPRIEAKPLFDACCSLHKAAAGQQAINQPVSHTHRHEHGPSHMVLSQPRPCPCAAWLTIV
jgi:hypothetical protein